MNKIIKQQEMRSSLLLVITLIFLITLSSISIAQSHPASQIKGGNFSNNDFEFPLNLYINQGLTLRNGDLNVNNNALLNIDWSTSDDGSGSGLDADTIDNQNYNSNWPTTQSNIQSALSNDFHNIGGTDDDVPEAGDFGAAVDLDANGNVADDSHNHIYSNIDATTSANWASRITDETGSGSIVFSNSPSLTTPSLGAATATTINTGQGANKLYDMNQNVLTTSAVTFSTVRADSGLYVGDDEYFYRGAEDIIRTDDSIYVTSNVAVDGVIESSDSGLGGSLNLNDGGNSRLDGSLTIEDNLLIQDASSNPSVTIYGNNDVTSYPRIKMYGAGSITVEGSGYIIMDSNNDQTTTGIFIGRNSDSVSGNYNALFKFAENGNLNTIAGGYQDSGSCVAGTCASDRRLKKDIKYLNGSLERIKILKPASFGFYNESDGNPAENYGLIAQEVLDTYPEWVEVREDGYYALKYGLNIEMEMLQAIIELREQKNNEISRLKGENEILREALCEIDENISICI